MHTHTQTYLSKCSLWRVREVVLVVNVHYLYDVEVVEADGQGQTTEQHGTEQQAVLVCGMIRGQVVEVEDTDAKYSEVRTYTQIRHNAHRQQLHTHTHTHTQTHAYTCTHTHTYTHTHTQRQ